MPEGDDGIDADLVERVRHKMFGSYGWAASTLVKQRQKAREAIQAVLAALDEESTDA